MLKEILQPKDTLTQSCRKGVMTGSFKNNSRSCGSRACQVKRIIPSTSQQQMPFVSQKEISVLTSGCKNSGRADPNQQLRFPRETATASLWHNSVLRSTSVRVPLMLELSAPCKEGTQADWEEIWKVLWDVCGVHTGRLEGICFLCWGRLPRLCWKIHPSRWWHSKRWLRIFWGLRRKIGQERMFGSAEGRRGETLCHHIWDQRDETAVRGGSQVMAGATKRNFLELLEKVKKK